MTDKTIYERLLSAQKKIEPVTKDASNPFFKSSYATLGQVIEAVKQILNDEGIIVIQPIMDNKVFTILVGGKSEDEQIKDGGTPIVCAKPNDPQAQGSAITYARRYGLMSLLCLSAEDDDGEKATSHASPNAPQSKVTAKPTSDTSVACGVCGGATTFREGTNKDGKKWQGYFCNTDRNHQPKFVSVKQDEFVDKIINDY